MNFSPSLHLHDLHGSNSSEHLYAAEQHGINSEDCNKIYKCHHSPLEHLTILEEENNEINE